MVPYPNGGHTLKFTQLSEVFAIGFSEASDLSFFEEKTSLVQVDFWAKIPWVIDKALENQ